MFDMQDNIQRRPPQIVIASPGGYRDSCLKYIPILCLYLLGLVTPTFASTSFSYNVPQSPSLVQALPLRSPRHCDIIVRPFFRAEATRRAVAEDRGNITRAHSDLANLFVPLSYHACQYFHDETLQPGKKPSIFSETEDKKSPPKVHPRKKLLEETPIHTQKAWLYAAVIPGLGQLYNKSYWEIPVIYGIFGLLAWGAIYNHDEYMDTKRDLLKKMKKDKSKESAYPNLVNYMDGRKRDRTIFVASMFVWYLLNVFEAYVGGTLKTFDVSDDLEVVIQPNNNSNAPQNTSIGLNISLQSKGQDENRSHWIW